MAFMEYRSHSDKIMPRRALQLIAFLWVAFFLIMYALHPPFWSRMDDAANLSRVHGEWSGRSFWEVVRNQTATEMEGIGMFRPLYPAYSYLFYKGFQSSSVAAYLSLLVFILTCFWFAGMLFERATGVQPPRAGRLLFFILCCAFTPHSNLYLHASILEKFVLVSALLSLGLLLHFSSSLTGKNAFLLATGLVFSLSIGFLAKPNTLFLLGPIVAWLLLAGWQSKRRVFLAVAAVLILIGVPAGLFFLKIRGDYSSRYDLSSMSGLWAHVDKRTQVYGLLAVAALAASVAANYAKSRDWRRAFAAGELFWPVGLLSFLVVMLPWPGGAGTYYVTPAGIFIVGSALLVLFHIYEYSRGRSWVLVSPVALASLLALRPLASRISTQAGLQDVASWVRELGNGKEASASFVAMPTPCEETSLSVSYFSGRKGAVALAQADSLPPAAQNHNVYMITLRDCPPRPISGFHFTEPIFVKGEWKIYADAGTNTH